MGIEVMREGKDGDMHLLLCCYELKFGEKWRYEDSRNTV